MSDERLRCLWKVILILYAGSFVLPFRPTIGASAFVMAFLGIFLLTPSGSILGWSWFANPFFWSGLYHLKEGRFDRAASRGFLACILASIPMIPVGRVGTI